MVCPKRVCEQKYSHIHIAEGTIIDKYKIQGGAYVMQGWNDNKSQEKKSGMAGRVPKIEKLEDFEKRLELFRSPKRREKICPKKRV